MYVKNIFKGGEGGRGPLYITSTSKVVAANIKKGILIPFGARLLNSLLRAPKRKFDHRTINKMEGYCRYTLFLRR